MGATSEHSAAGARLTIDLGALAENWRTLAAMAPNAETAAVVKADAYGIGVARAAPALLNAGCRTFFVATLQEGIDLRALLPNVAIFVLNGLAIGKAAEYAAHRLQPVLNSKPELDEWRNAGLDLRPAIQIDTGMNRLGLPLAEAESLLSNGDLMQALDPALVLSHLACADEPGNAKNAEQLVAFGRVRSMLPGVRASFANSAGIMLGPDYQFDLTRPGIALYGGRASVDRPALRTVVTAEAPVLQLRDAAPGETVGYGARQTLKRPARLATLGVGYADGYHRAAGSSDERRGASIFVRGEAAPLVGRVSMDLMVADVTGIDGVTRGDWGELFGPNIMLDDVAERAGTIGYELLTDLGRRYERRYVG